jgi:dihydropteroate synthase
MQRRPHYDDVVAEVHGFLLTLAERARAAGVGEVWLDPGIGFGKTTEDNLSLLGHVGELVRSGRRVGHRVLVGTSRKRFLGHLSGPVDRPPLDVSDREEASLATAVWSLARGVAMVRVHDVAPSVQAARLVGAAGDRADDAPMTGVPA